MQTESTQHCDKWGTFVRMALVSITTLVISGGATGQAFPTRPITIIYNNLPGSGGDILTRAGSAEAAKILGQPVVVENRAGANGRLGLAALRAAPGDGHVLNVVNNALVIFQPIADTAFKFDPQSDYVPVSVLFESPLVLTANPGMPFRDMKSLIGYAKANPGKLNFAITAGAASHFLAERWMRALDIKVTLIPYKGENAGAAATLGGQTDLLFGTVVKPMVDAGKLIALATTGRTRWKPFPDTLTFREAGVPFSAPVWYPMLAPAGTPASVVKVLSAAFDQAYRTPEVAKRLDDLGFTSPNMGPDETLAYIRSELDAWRPVIQSAGIKLE